MITVRFDTDDFRGDRSADRSVLVDYNPETTLAEVLLTADGLRTRRGDRATVVILPKLPEATQEGAGE